MERRSRRRNIGFLILVDGTATSTHSLTYTHDCYTHDCYTHNCYTQEGVNGTFKLSDHWTIQAGISAGCDSALRTKDAKATGNLCIGYTWSLGGDNLYACAKSLNDSRYAYNNLAAYYLTWYHKINAKWHTATESWYQYESHRPNVNNPAAASLIQTNANGAYCNRPDELTCNAPDWSVLNYTNRQLGKHDFISSKRVLRRSARPADRLQNQLRGGRDFLESLDRNHDCAPPRASV